MKKITLFAAIFMFAFTSNVFAQVSTDGTATTTVIAPLTITSINDLAFGNVTQNGNGGTVEVTAAESPTTNVTGGAQAVDGTVSAGSFDVTGETGNVYTITLPSATTTLTGAGVGEPTINVSGLNSNIAQGTIGTDPTFYVGGIITLGTDQLPDTYTGTYTVTVQYL